LFENHNELLVKELKSNPHPDWGIPVFAREDKQGKIIALGLAKMPRKLYDLSTQQVISNTQKLSQSKHTFDFTELMFGTLRDHGFSLKSRVIFSDAECASNKGLYLSSPMILGAPKSSYLAAYIEQHADKSNTVANQFKQYEKGSQIKGWKRYPTQSEFNSIIPRDLQNKIDVQSQMELIKPKSLFKGKLVFHNLKKEELGALLWVLQFKDSSGNKYQHGLGHGKPLGAGAVQFDDLILNLRANQINDEEMITTEILSDYFCEHMNQNYPDNSDNSWQNSAQLKHMFAFGDRDDNNGKNLTYMPLNSPKDSSQMSYTESNKGRAKKSLPNWQSRNELLSRSESVEQNAPTSFAKGRLSDLIKSDKDSPLSMYENSLVQLAEQQKKDNEFSQLSPHQQLFIQLKERLKQPEIKASKEGRQSCNQQIEDLLTLCLDEQVEGDFIGELISLCRDLTQTAYLDLANNKKNKPKLQARKEKLVALSQKYQVII
jgi:hypothetical protein